MSQAISFLFALSCVAVWMTADSMRMNKKKAPDVAKLNMSTVPEGNADALMQALQIVGKSGSEDLRRLVDSYQPVYMVAGGTSQGKDSLMMMLMGLPFAFQGSGVATRAPCLYRTFPSSDGKTTVTMRFKDSEKSMDVAPTDVVTKIEEYMHSLGDRFGEEPVDITVACPTCRQSVYKNMMGRVVGMESGSRQNEKMIDRIYANHAKPSNVMVVAVEKVTTLSQNSMILPFAFKTDPKGDRTIFVKSWADYGISEVSASSGASCEEAQKHFSEFDFNKQGDNDAPTFWIATVKEGRYTQDHSLTFEERTEALEEAIAKQEDKMRKFLEDWKEQDCHFDFAENVYVTQLRDHIASVHQKTMFARLPEVLKALQKEKKSMEVSLKKQEVALKKMPGGDTPSMELLFLMGTFENIFNEQWMGEQLPTNELPKHEIEEIQGRYFNMNAVDFATQLVESWQTEADPEFLDAGFDNRLIEVSKMLKYETATQLLTYSSHFWLHLTNMYMLVVRSVKDLLEPRDLNRLSNIGNVGRTGADKCNAAVIEAKHAFRKGGSERGQKLMQYGVKFLLKKHTQATFDIFKNLPSVQPYAADKDLMFTIEQAIEEFVEEWSENFLTEYQKFLFMVSTNIQQGKVLKMLNGMRANEEDEDATQTKNIKSCAEIDGAVPNKNADFPSCKCKDYKASLFCGTDEILNEKKEKQRKFNVTAVKKHPSCKYAMPYCAKEKKTHQFSNLAALLNPRPENCDTLYDELVDSSIDILVNNVGSLMYYLAYDQPEAPIVKRNGFSSLLFNKIKGEGFVVEDLLRGKFKSLGQKKILADKVHKGKTDINDMDQAIAFFQKAYLKS